MEQKEGMNMNEIGYTMVNGYRIPNPLPALLTLTQSARSYTVPLAKRYHI